MALQRRCRRTEQFPSLFDPGASCGVGLGLRLPESATDTAAPPSRPLLPLATTGRTREAAEGCESRREPENRPYEANVGGSIPSACMTKLFNASQHPVAIGGTGLITA
jgi:hypothetical protein